MVDSESLCTCNVIHENIVNDVRSKMVSDDEYLNLADLMQLFGDYTRVKILHALEQSEMCVCDIAELLGMTVSAVSHQLRVLKSAKLVKFRKEGKSVFYSLADEHVGLILAQGMEHVRE